MSSDDDVPPSETQQVRRRGINRLLADIYGKKHFLSDILRDGGISQADITRIYEEQLRIFLDELLAIWRVAFAGELTPGAWYILTRSYGLDGIASTLTERLAQELAISQQSVSEIHAQTLKILRAPASRSHLESLTIVVARQQLRRM
jgi:DNA-directed RNA polymerase sigma subunit (sigma70/sigma32)